MNVEISDTWAECGVAVVAGVVGWLVRLESRLNARPTRREQEAIAAKVADKIDCQFAEIKGILEKQNDATALNRQLVADSLAEIRTKVAVLRDRVGDDPLGDTGAHRRRL